MLIKTILFLGLIICSLAFNPQFKDCNFTDFRFQSEYNLGQQDELDKTFQAIEGKFIINDITYPINSYTNYSFTSIKTTLNYNDAKQRAEIMGRDTIVIGGGYLEAVVQMNWKRKDFLQRGGSLQALCKSNQILFAKNLTIERGFLVYEVSGYYDISFDAYQCKLTRYEPANISSLDLQYINQLLNQRDDKKQTIKNLLATEINKKYFYELNNSLYNERHQLDDKFFYNYTNSNKKKTVSIEYQVIPTGVDIEKQGLSFTYVTEIRDYDNWECAAAIPHDNLPVKQYGGIQEFLSLSVFKNTLKYAIEVGVLDTVLNKDNWKFSMFQFFAGDLYEVIPYLAQMYLARDSISGSCKALTQNLIMTADQKQNILTVRTQHLCDLYVREKTKILSFKIDLYSNIEAKFQQESKVNFYVRSFKHNLSYFEQPMFKIQHYDLANAIVLNSLNTIVNMKTFGSGWPTAKMDLPQMKVFALGYVFFFDSSHIGQSQA